MKTLIIITALLLCAPAWGDSTRPNDLPNCTCDADGNRISTCASNGKCEFYLPKVEKSKRQEYLDKCDEYLELTAHPDCASWYGSYYDCIASKQRANSMIAQAYCLRASLEEK